MKQFLIKKHSYRYVVIEATDSEHAITQLNDGNVEFSGDSHYDNTSRFTIHLLDEVATVPSNKNNENSKGRY